MKTEYIKEILEKYYEGFSSAEEEKILIDYFSTENIAPELANEQLIFNSLHSIEEVPFNDQLESRLENIIDVLDKKERAIAKTATSKKRNIRPFFWVSSVAASLILLISIGYLYQQHNEYQVESSTISLKDTYSDPEKAYAEAEKALILMSEKLNIGLSGIDSMNEGVEKSNEIIEKNLTKIKNK